MAKRRELHGMRVGGLIVTGIGVFFLLQELELIPDMHRMWPVIPIIVGVSLLVTSFSRSSSEDDPES